MPRRLAGSLASLLLALAVGGCGSAEPVPEAGVTDARTIGGGRQGDAAPTAVTGLAATDVQSIGDAGVTVVLPVGWHSTTADDGAIIDPLTRLVVASSPIRPRDSACQIAAYEFAEDAVALVVVEWTEPMATVPARPSQFTSRELPVRPTPAIECFAGAGGSVQFVDQGRTFGAYLLAGPRATDVLVADARRVLETLNVEPAQARRLARNGVSVAVPLGWDARILFRDPGGSRGVLFQVANFELPRNEGFEPPRELPWGEEDRIKAMDVDDVLVTIGSDEAGGEPAPQTVTVDALRLLPAGAPRVPHGHLLAEGFLCFGARCLRIEIDFGGGTTTPALRRHVDDVLGSIVVEPGPSSTGGSAEAG